MRMFCLSAAIPAALLCVSITTAQDNDPPLAKATPVAESGKEQSTNPPAAKKDEPVAKAVPSKASASSRPLGATISLTNQSVIRGTLTDTVDIQMKTGLGELTIPLSEVAGIRFATEQDTSTTIVLLNGDSLTGATDLKRMTVETEWGNAQVNGTGISSILLVPKLQWTSIAGLNGKRWYLTDENASPTPAPATRGTVSSLPQSTSQPVPSTAMPLPSSSIPMQGNVYPRSQVLPNGNFRIESGRYGQ